MTKERDVAQLIKGKDQQPNQNANMRQVIVDSVDVDGVTAQVYFANDPANIFQVMFINAVEAGDTSWILKHGTSMIGLGTITPSVAAPTAYGWWTECGRTTLGSASDTITVSGMTVGRYVKILVHLFDTGGSIRGNLRFNNDSGNNYAYRRSPNGAADSTNTSQAEMVIHGSNSASELFYTLEATNYQTDPKIVVGWATVEGASGAANLPDRIEFTGKWDNSSNLITRVDILNVGAGDFATGSEVVVLTHD